MLSRIPVYGLEGHRVREERVPYQARAGEMSWATRSNAESLTR